MASSLNAAYGLGVRRGLLLKSTKTRIGAQAFISDRWNLNTPRWLMTGLQRFCWRQGVKNGAGLPTIASTLTLMFIGE